MTLQQQIISRHRNFRAEIARRAALVPQREDRTYFIPNTPFGVKKINPMNPVRIRFIEPNPEPAWWYCMWFGDLVSARPFDSVGLTVAAVLQAVSNYYGTPKIDILSQRRTRGIVRPRQVCYYLSKKLTLKSLPEIGRRLGDRDHTTVLSGVRKIESLRATDAKIDADVRAIAASLGGLL